MPSDAAIAALKSSLRGELMDINAGGKEGSENVYGAIPESPSEELAVTSKLPLPVGRKKTTLPTAEALPTKFENAKLGALGSEVSTLTVVDTEAVLPMLSVPVSVYR